MKKKKIFFTGLAFILLIGLIAYQTGLFATGKVKPGRVNVAEKIPKGKIFKVKKSNEKIIYQAVGTIHSRAEVELSPRLTARIINVNVRSGDSVKKNDILIQLDDVDLKAAVEQAKQQVNVAQSAIASAEDYVSKSKSAFELSEIAFNRYQTLLDKKVIAQKTYDEAKAVFEQSQAALSRAKHEKNGADSMYIAAENSLKQTEALLSYACIKSPMDGIVSERLADPGDLATPGNVLMTIFDPTRLMMYVPIRESLVANVKVNDSFTFHVEALNKDIGGVVREIVASVDPGSRTFLVKSCLANPDNLMPGMFGTVKMNVGSEDMILIPSSALIRIGELEYVFIVKEDETSKVFVRTVKFSKDKLRVISGLHDGDKILTDISF
jgi:RND family efflux transporter MFP subunit